MNAFPKYKYAIGSMGNLSKFMLFLLFCFRLSGQEWHQWLRLNDGNVNAYSMDSLSKMTFENGVVKWTLDNGTIIENNRSDIDSALVVVYSSRHSCGAENVHNPNLPYGTIMDHEGNEYRTIVIGNQRWMAENLKTSKYRNGDDITPLTLTEWGSTTDGAWMFYNDNPELNCPYGKLYNWYAISDERHVCPSGWHIPTVEDLNEMIRYLDPDAAGRTATDFGAPMLLDYNRLLPLVNSVGSVQNNDGYWQVENSHQNSSGLSLLPSGSVNGQSSYELGLTSSFWLAYADSNNGEAYFEVTKNFNSNSPNYANLETFRYDPLGLGYNVRCVEDELGGLISGCNDSNACNYNVMAEFDDNSCVYPTERCDDGMSITVDEEYDAFCDCYGLPTGIDHSCGILNFHKAELNYDSITDYEGNEYKTIVIGNQEWMAENLKTSVYQNGIPLDIVQAGQQLSDNATGTWTYLNNDPSNNCPKGKLYNWEAVSHPAGICPIGWHVPTKQDFDTLLRNADPNYDGNFSIYQGWIAARHLSRQYSIYSGDVLLGSDYWFNSATNRTGFSASVSGSFKYNYWSSGFSGFDYAFDEFLCWSSSVSPDFIDPEGRYALRVGSMPYSTSPFTPHVAGAAVVTVSSKNGLPIRCVRD